MSARLYGCERASTEQAPSSPDPDKALPPFRSPVREVREELAREAEPPRSCVRCRWPVWGAWLLCHWCSREGAQERDA